LVCVGVPIQCGYGGVVSLCSLKIHYNRVSSVTTNMVFSTSIIARMVLYGNVLFLDFLAGLLQQSIPVASSLLARYVFAVYVSALCNGIIWTDAL